MHNATHTMHNATHKMKRLALHCDGRMGAAARSQDRLVVRPQSPGSP
jgi:hypothetical protein